MLEVGRKSPTSEIVAL
uniref:Uncharacterized protein n=1 Tax=Anguilla anguilla TaxID=7936 RepID=A0A0E9UNI4_ANGAN